MQRHALHLSAPLTRHLKASLCRRLQCFAAGRKPYDASSQRCISSLCARSASGGHYGGAVRRSLLPLSRVICSSSSAPPAEHAHTAHAFKRPLRIADLKARRVCVLCARCGAHPKLVALSLCAQHRRRERMAAYRVSVKRSLSAAGCALCARRRRSRS